MDIQRLQCLDDLIEYGGPRSTEVSWMVSSDKLVETWRVLLLKLEEMECQRVHVSDQ